MSVSTKVDKKVSYKNCTSPKNWNLKLISNLRPQLARNKIQKQVPTTKPKNEDIFDIFGFFF